MEREVLAEEVDRGLHLLASRLSDGAAELAVRAFGLDVDERDGHDVSLQPEHAARVGMAGHAEFRGAARR